MNVQQLIGQRFGHDMVEVVGSEYPAHPLAVRETPEQRT
jgi:hypothetical protein